MPDPFGMIGLTVLVAITSQSLLDWVPLVVAVAAFLVALGAATLPYLRRPRLSLHPDSDRTHSRVEGDNLPYMRLLVRNAKGKRSAQQARVVLDGYKGEGDAKYTRLGSPFLGWPSTFGQDSDSYVAVIFSDAARPVGLGRFARVRVNPDGRLEREERYTQVVGRAVPTPIRHFPDPQAAPDTRWHLHLELADAYAITDERDWLSPGAWTIRLIIGAHDGDARAYEVTLSWKGDEKDAQAVLSSALDSLRISAV